MSYHIRRDQGYQAVRMVLTRWFQWLNAAIYGIPVQYIMTTASLGGQQEESCRWWICALYPRRSSIWHQEWLEALSPIYQGTIELFHHHIYLFSLPSSPMGNSSTETWLFKCVVKGKGTVHMYVCTLSVSVCLLLPPDIYTRKTKADVDQLNHLMSRMSHLSELHLTLVNECSHGTALNGSKALLLCPWSWRSGWNH